MFTSDTGEPQRANEEVDFTDFLDDIREPGLSNEDLGSLSISFSSSTSAWKTPWQARLDAIKNYIPELREDGIYIGLGYEDRKVTGWLRFKFARCHTCR